MGSNQCPGCYVDFSTSFSGQWLLWQLPFHCLCGSGRPFCSARGAECLRKGDQCLVLRQEDRMSGFPAQKPERCTSLTALSYPHSLSSLGVPSRIYGSLTNTDAEMRMACVQAMAQVRENQMDNPEFVDMMLQRWFIQKGAAKGAPGCWCGECLQRPWCQDSVSTIWLRGANLLRNSGSCNVDNSEKWFRHRSYRDMQVASVWHLYLLTP